MVNNFNKDEYVYLLKLAQGDQTLNGFAKKAGLSPGNLSRIMRGQLARPATLARIAAASSHVNHEELMTAAGYMNFRPQTMRQPSDNQGDEVVTIPLIKEVHGTPRKVRKNKNNPMVSLSTTFFGGGTQIIFEVNDDAFAPRFSTGDWVIVDMDRQPQNGDIVLLVLKKRESMLRRFIMAGNRCQLYSDNSALLPVVVNKNEVKIYGTVVGAIAHI